MRKLEEAKQEQTVRETMDRLRSNPRWLAQRDEQRRQHRSAAALLLEDEQPLVLALRDGGVGVNSVWDLVNSAASCAPAIPILVAHLEKPYHPRNREGIVRAPAVKEARPTAWEPLLRAYENCPAEEQHLPPLERGLKDALAGTISFIAGKTKTAELQRLARDRRHGGSRVFFVEALGKVGTDDVIPTLIELSRDEDSDVRNAAERVLRTRKGSSRGKRS